MATRKDMASVRRAAMEWERNSELTQMEDWIDGYRDAPPPRFVSLFQQVTDGLSPEAFTALERIGLALWRLARYELQAREAAA